MQALILTGRPLGKEQCSGILTAKKGSQRSFEGAAEQHRRPGVLLLPAIEIAMPIAPRAGEILADLGITEVIRPPEGCRGLQVKVLPNGRREQNRRVGAGK